MAGRCKEGAISELCRNGCKLESNTDTVQGRLWVEHYCQLTRFSRSCFGVLSVCSSVWFRAFFVCRARVTWMRVGVGRV